MVSHLFDGFLSSEDTYREAEAFWASLVQECADAAGQSSEWHRWWPSTYGDGRTPLDKDEKPIFDVKCDRLKKAVTISQARPESDDLEIEAWLRELGYGGIGQYAGVNELVINLAASEEAAEVARRLIVAWMNEDTDPEAMSSFIEECISSQ